MERRDFLRLTGAAAVCSPLAAAPARRTNVVFFLVDDLGWTDLACWGSRFYETPHLDRLRQRAMAFTSGYAACPVCSPTRASIMTGKYPARLRTTDFFGAAQPDKWTRNTRLLPAPYTPYLAHEETTLAEAFKAGGYATFFCGKWHLGAEEYWPERQGFDYNRGGTNAGAPPGGGRYFSPYGNRRLPDGPPGEHLPDRLATETCKFIEAHRDRPFLAYHSFYSVHVPLMARPDLEAKYKAKKAALDLPKEIWGAEGPRKLRLVQEHAIYAGMVEAMDAAVGKVLDKLDALGLTDNTAIVFMSDNGGLSTAEGHPTSNLPLRAGKGWLYEGGIREPLMIAWPGVTRGGSTCDTPVISTDFYPTLLEICGLPPRPEQTLDGVSLVPLLRGGDRLERDAIFWHYPHYGNQGGSPGGAIRQGEWKLIEWYEPQRPIELYHLTEDIGEKRNLAPDRPGTCALLYGRLQDWRRSVGAVMPTPNPAWDPQQTPWE